jgi:RNA polymerase-interacting CarD/CdnL/TRCF family regulator
LDLSSDHTPIILTISTHPILKPATPKIATSKTNWNLFNTHVNEQINLQIPLKTPDDIDRAVQNITGVLQEAAWISTPVSNRNAAHTNSPLHIRELVTNKRRARSLWQRSRNPRDKNVYNRLSRQLKRELQEIRNTSFDTYITSLSKEDHSIWKATKQFKRPITHIPPLRKMDGSWARTDLEKANVFAEYLATVFTPHSQSTSKNNDNDEDIEEFLNSPCPPSLPIHLFTPAEVKNTISNCNNHKAPGFDLITAEVLKQIPRKTLVLLTYIYIYTMVY